MKKAFLKIFVKLTGKRMGLSLIFIKVTGWVVGISSKMRLRLSYLTVNFTKFWDHLFHTAV